MGTTGAHPLRVVRTAGNSQVNSFAACHEATIFVSKMPHRSRN
jgi:hypothetical protein